MAPKKTKRKYTTSPKVGQGTRGLPKKPGTGTQMNVQDEKYGMTLMEKAYSMIHDNGVQDFVKKDLILGLLRLVTPSMKAIDMTMDQPPTSITFNTNLAPGPMKVIDGKTGNRLSGAQDVIGLSQ